MKRAFGREQVLLALKAGGGHSLHVMEILQILGAPKDSKEDLRDVLSDLRELGLAKELPGNRYKAAAGRKAFSPPPPPEAYGSPKKAAPREETEARRLLEPKSGARSSFEPKSGARSSFERRASERKSPAPQWSEPEKSPAPQWSEPEKSPAPKSAVPRSELGRNKSTRRTTGIAPLSPETDIVQAPHVVVDLGNEVLPADHAVGWLTITARGFAFVACDDGGPDVFIPARGIGIAMHGDRVEVTTRPTQQGREGEVFRVIEHGLRRVAGVLTKKRREYTIETHDARLPPEFRVVGTLPLETDPGMDVVAQVTRWPDFLGDTPEARVLRTLGPRGAAETEIAKILIRESVVEEFAEPVTQEALGFPAEVPQADLAGREDLRELDFTTIDPDDARDHDDALWAETLADGGYRVIVAIADVSHYVRVGSAIDKEALARGTSIYLPGRAIPMLPPELSTNLASLVPDEDRLTLAVEVYLGRMGKVVSHRFVEGVIRSRARLTYGGVARALGLSDEPPVQPEAESRLPMLRTLHTISKRLRALRKRRGGLEFELPEAKVVLDRKSGEPTDIVQSRSDPGLKQAYEIVEDLMLLANEVVAAELSKRKLPAIYRVHGSPDPTKVENFARVAQAFGFALDEDAATSPKKLQAFLNDVRGTAQAGALGFLLLRAMQQAQYDVNNLGHFALAARNYLHFTSPIRRYPDLAVHRVVRALARGESIERETLRERMQSQATQSSRMERRAMTVERDCMSLYRCLLMKDRLGEEFEGVISSVAEHGLNVTLDSPFVEVRVPVDRLGADYYELDRLGIRLVGKRTKHTFALGQRLVVVLEGVSMERREMVAAPRVSAPAAGESRLGKKNLGRGSRATLSNRGDTRSRKSSRSEWDEWTPQSKRTGAKRGSFEHSDELEASEIKRVSQRSSATKRADSNRGAPPRGVRDSEADHTESKRASKRSESKSAAKRSESKRSESKSAAKHSESKRSESKSAAKHSEAERSSKRKDSKPESAKGRKRRK